MSDHRVAVESVFAPVRSPTAFEETLDRLATAIKLGLLVPGSRLPPERELCSLLGIARSTLRQALTALAESGHLHAVRGRGGGTFVADPQPPAGPPSPQVLANWRSVCDERVALEIGVAVLATRRADADELDRLDAVIVALDDTFDDFAAFRTLDIRFHVGLAEAAGNSRLLAAMTETQGAMSDLIALIAHPREVLASSNDQHKRLVKAMRAGKEQEVMRVMSDHVSATEYVLAGLLPD